MSDTNCPHCRSKPTPALKGRGGQDCPTYDCGTMKNGPWMSELCKERQAHNKTKEENKRQIIMSNELTTELAETRSQISSLEEQVADLESDLNSAQEELKEAIEERDKARQLLETIMADLDYAHRQKVF